MRILVICQHYFPDPFRITDICEALVQEGHEVTVVAGTPSYPVEEGVKWEENSLPEERNGVLIYRCKTHPRKQGAIHRFWNYVSYARSSKKFIKKHEKKYDVVFAYQLSPVMMAEAGIAYKKKTGKKLVLYCLDLWPESLCVGGVKNGSLFYKIFQRISKKIYRSADKILITSRTFREYLKEHFNIADKKIAYLPQYAETQFLDLESKEQGEDFHLVFAGNIGAAQDIPTIIGAARLLKEEEIYFHIVGDGTELANVREQAKDLPKVIFYGRKPLEEMPTYYGMADAMLITLTDDPVISKTLPGKVQTYMAARKPIVGAIGGETAVVLAESQGGYCGEAGNAALLAENIQSLRTSGTTTELGTKNRAYYLEHFSKEKFIKDLMNHLQAEV